MATIRVLQAIGGLDFSWRRGDLVELPDDVAAQWADGVRTELVDQDPPTTPPSNDPQPTADPAGVPVVVGEHGPEAPPPADPTNPETPDGPEVFNPADHNVKDVLAYLDGVGEEEALRVLQQEQDAEEPRKGILGQRGSILERAQENDQNRADQTRVERAAETSRGGGRGDAIETR